MIKVTGSERFHLTTKIFIGMLLGIAVGLICNTLPQTEFFNLYVIEGLSIVGQIFLIIIKMLVVPVVLVSLVTGTCQLKSGSKLGKLAIKTLLLYVVTTAVAITLALFVANFVGIGSGAHLTAMSNFAIQAAPSFTQVILDIFPDNPFEALAEGNMLQIIIFAVLIGGAISMSGRSGKYVASFFSHFNEVLLTLVQIIMRLAPYGIFCIVAALFSRIGLSVFGQLVGYFITTLFVLALQWVVVYGGLIQLLARLNPLLFFKNKRVATPL